MTRTPPAPRDGKARRAARRRGGRLAGVLPAGAAVLALASCGVSTTGVIEAGEPATVPAAPLAVYFVRDGQVAAVPRQVPGDPTLPATVEALFGGPTAAEAAKGYGTELPVLPQPPKVVVAKRTVTVVLPVDRDALSPTAVLQIVCTAAGVLRRDFPPDAATVTRPPDLSVPAPAPRGAEPVAEVTVIAGSWSVTRTWPACP